MTPEIYIVLSEGNQRLVIEGPLHLYNRFLSSLENSQPKEAQHALTVNPDNALAAHIQPR